MDVWAAAGGLDVSAGADRVGMEIDRPFIGSEALASGRINRHQLRTRYRPLFPNVYLHNELDETLRRRIAAAWLWSDRTAVIGGMAAASLHGCKYVDDDVAIDLFCAKPRAPRGLVTRRDRLAVGETSHCGRIAVTSVQRTGFDLGRWLPLDSAVARLDALCRANRAQPADILMLAATHPGVRGLRRLEAALELVDPGAESLQETWLRLLILRAGFPPPRTQVRVYDGNGRFIGRVDISWKKLKIAVEYDGEQHRTDRRQYRKDVRRLELLHRAGWIVIRVLVGDGHADIIRRVHDAFAVRRAQLAA